MSNVLNYFDQPDSTGDNALHLTGSVYVTGTQFVDSSITITTGNSINIASGGSINVASGGAVTVASGGTLTSNGSLAINGTSTINSVAFTAQKFANVLGNNEFLVRSTNGALINNGFNVITGGTGLSGLTLAAPQPGMKCVITLATISSGTCIVTTAAGVTFDGTNNTATFNAANDQLMLVYNSTTQWQIVFNNSVSLSLV